MYVKALYTVVLRKCFLLSTMSNTCSPLRRTRDTEEPDVTGVGTMVCLDTFSYFEKSLETLYYKLYYNKWLACFCLHFVFQVKFENASVAQVDCSAQGCRSLSGRASRSLRLHMLCASIPPNCYSGHLLADRSRIASCSIRAAGWDSEGITTPSSDD